MPEIQEPSIDIQEEIEKLTNTVLYLLTEIRDLDNHIYDENSIETIRMTSKNTIKRIRKNMNMNEPKES